MIAHVRPSGIRIGASIAGLLLVGGVLAGCTGDAEPEPTETPTSTEAPDAGVTDIEDAPGTGEGLEGAKDDLELANCALDGDSWALDGTVTNSSDAAADYRIYLALLNGGGDTRGLVQVNVDGVEPGASEEWSTTVDLDEADLTCVPRVERYAAG
ncbi:MAG: hypothetical protein ABW040_07355 [Microbacteriaceae bacterium]